MLTMSTANLRAGWFSGTGGGRSQFLGPGGYFSTEGFPPEAYTVEADWLVSPEVSIAEQLLAEDVVGSLPGVGTTRAMAPPTSKMIASMAIAAIPAEQLYVPLLYVEPGNPSLPECTGGAPVRLSAQPFLATSDEGCEKVSRASRASQPDRHTFSTYHVQNPRRIVAPDFTICPQRNCSSYRHCRLVW